MAYCLKVPKVSTYPNIFDVTVLSTFIQSIWSSDGASWSWAATFHWVCHCLWSIGAAFHLFGFGMGFPAGLRNWRFLWSITQ